VLRRSVETTTQSGQMAEVMFRLVQFYQQP
jgi:hypothetical protein